MAGTQKTVPQLYYQLRDGNQYERQPVTRSARPKPRFVASTEGFVQRGTGLRHAPFPPFLRK